MTRVKRTDSAPSPGTAAALPPGLAPFISSLDLQPADLTPLPPAGSTRRFWRTPAGIISLTPDSATFERVIALGAALRDAALPLPRLLASAPRHRLALHQDVGNTSLLRHARAHAGPAAVEPPPRPLPRGPLGAAAHDACRDALDILPRLRQAQLPPCALPPFDRTDLRWETWYGLTHHYWGRRRRRPESPAHRADLDAELDAIAGLVANAPQAPIHRDYQSTNIHIVHDAAAAALPGTPPPGIYLLDWADTRRGPLLYDLVSLLWDPYLDLTATDRETLLAAHPLPNLRRNLLEATAIQRLLQALGAFAYLARHRARPHFLPFAAAAERALADLVRPYPALHRIVAP